MKPIFNTFELLAALGMGLSVVILILAMILPIPFWGKVAAIASLGLFWLAGITSIEMRRDHAAE